MIKKTILLSGLLLSSASKSESIFEEFEKLSQKMREAFDSEFEKFSTKTGRAQAIFKISEDPDYVTVILKVDNPDQDGIKIDAKKNKLKGSLKTTDGGEIRFEVIDGKAFSIATQLKSEKESEKTFQSSNNYSTLPSKVANLEETKVELKDDVLTLKFPKADEGWKKIEVK
ncbi:hypothetical protein A3F66_03910 [candidate division TM6 bacterium RIFCSPHIGHO2_12_FULL_32_22]|nr:MAG: hypothetical protein A3F66_03910 [candidate division TM6 bacterium RIFCSPHIGHO2_12_FULL_32_22]